MRRVAAALAAVALAACGAVEQRDPAGSGAVAAATQQPSATPSSATADLVAYLGRLRGMNDNALTAEAARQKRASGDAARVKAAFALSLVAASDDAEITALVDPIARNEAADRDLRAMASYLQALASDRRRLKEGSASAQARLRDERRLAEAQKQRADALQQKLDALTELERSLTDRAAGR